jgi:hypothetical protein
MIIRRNIVTKFNINAIVRQARVVADSKHGVSQDGYGSIDSNPDRLHFEIEAIGCTNQEFLDWFLQTKLGFDYCSDGRVLIDLGASRKLKVGETLNANYQEFFNSWLDSQVCRAKSYIADRVLLARAVLDIKPS